MRTLVHFFDGMVPSMEFLHAVSLGFHIAAGTIALLAGTAILLLRKGGKPHRRLGRVFFPAVIGVAASAFVLCVVHPDPFLFMVGVFTLYQGLSGFRAVRNKTLGPAGWDVLVALMGAANAVAMFTSGQVVLYVFGGISIFLVYGDAAWFRSAFIGKPLPPKLWLRRHIGFMMGAYIATVTAFLVVNFAHAGSGLLVWLAPTLVGVPLIVKWTRRHAGAPRVEGLV